MATTLRLHSTTRHQLGVAGRYDMYEGQGPSAIEATVNTTASGTEIQWTDTGGGQVLEWISPPLAAGFTLATTDTMTFNIWARESNMNANIGGRVRVYRWRRYQDSAIAELNNGPWSDGVEFGTSDAAMNWTGNVSTNVVFDEDDRLLVRYYITNVGTMGGSQTGTLSYDGPTGGADGDSYFQLNNNVTFKSEVLPGLVWPLPLIGSVSLMSGSEVAPSSAWLCHGMSVSDGAVLRDLSTGRSLSVVAGEGTTPMAGPGGIRFRHVLDRLAGPNFDTVLSASGGTLVVVGRAFRDGNLGTGSASSFLGGGSGTGLLWVIDSGSADTLTFRLSGTELSWSTYRATCAKPFVLAVTYGLRGMEIWVNGQLQASNATVVSYTPSTTPINLGRDATNGNAAANYLLGGLLIYRRQLSRATLQRLTSAPF